MFGLPLAEYVTSLPPGYWLARAIYKPGLVRWYSTRVELLGDRQGFQGDVSVENKKDLVRWINKKGLNRLRKTLYLEGVSTTERRLITVCDAPFYLYADPRASYGYIYLAAWKELACPHESPSAPCFSPLLV